MTIEEFNTYNANKNMPCEWIGQGSGYKDSDYDWENGNPTDIIYIPEYGYEDDGTVERRNAYSKEDFLTICDENDTVALDLFDSVDWQFPETLFNEWDSWYVEEAN